MRRGNQPQQTCLFKMRYDRCKIVLRPQRSTKKQWICLAQNSNAIKVFHRPHILVRELQKLISKSIADHRIAIHHNYDDEIRLASGEIELHSFEFHVGPEWDLAGRGQSIPSIRDGLPPFVISPMLMAGGGAWGEICARSRVIKWLMLVNTRRRLSL